MKELKIITKKTLEDAADAIRSKAGTSDPIAPEDFDDAIDAIPTGTAPTGTKTITENGTYDVTNFASAEVNCPSALMLGWTGDWWKSAGEWSRLPSEEMPTPEGQEAVLSVSEVLSPAPSEGDAVIACGSHNGEVIVAGTVRNYVDGTLVIRVAAMSSK
jgi:hypothetical protein